MTRATETRRKLATSIATAYAQNSKVAAVLLGGSAARGHADEFSDVEIGVFWHEPPTEDDRRNAIERAGGDLHHLHEYDADAGVWADDWKIGRNQQGDQFTGISVDMPHLLVATMQQTINTVVHEHDPDSEKQNLIAGVLDGVALHGEAFIQTWREASLPYPHELTRKVIQRHAQIDHSWRFEMFRSRGNVLLAHAFVAHIQERLLHVLLGLNRVYYFGFKSLGALTQRLNIAPSELLSRLQSCSDALSADTEQTLHDLVNQTYELIETNVGGIDVARLRRIFNYRRPLWEDFPPV